MYGWFNYTFPLVEGTFVRKGKTEGLYLYLKASFWSTKRNILIGLLFLINVKHIILMRDFWRFENTKISKL